MSELPLKKFWQEQSATEPMTLKEVAAAMREAGVQKLRAGGFEVELFNYWPYFTWNGYGANTAAAGNPGYPITITGVGEQTKLAWASGEWQLSNISGYAGGSTAAVPVYLGSTAPVPGIPS